jgi:eukaryotic-like serine/threonine-protein kinase
MAVPITSDELLEKVRKSGLIEDAALDDFVQQQTAQGSWSDEPKAVLEIMRRAGLITSFHVSHLIQGRYKGFHFGSYRVVEPIGSGGMSTVYLGEHRETKQRVAIKLLPPNLAEDPMAVARFQRESRAAIAVSHANIVATYEMGREGNGDFLVMEYVDGISLQDLVRNRGPLAPPRAANFIGQAAMGLQSIHESGLIHRDLKPGNLLLNREGKVKILDLGLARFKDDRHDDLTMRANDARILGTADYIAPEQALKSYDVDIRADIYALGCTFYYLLAGQPPFDSGSVTQKLLAHQIKQPAPITALRRDVPAEMGAVLQKMMAKDPKQRHQTPAEVVEALRPWLDMPIAPPTETELSRNPATSSGRYRPVTVPPTPVPDHRRPFPVAHDSKGPGHSHPTPPPKSPVRPPGMTNSSIVDLILPKPPPVDTETPRPMGRITPPSDVVTPMRLPPAFVPTREPEVEQYAPETPAPDRTKLFLVIGIVGIVFFFVLLFILMLVLVANM